MLSEPNFKTLPSEDDFYHNGDCDERYAIKTYYGKDIDFAQQQYYKYTPLGVVQDLIFIGTKAFRYYIFGAFRYLQDDNIDKDDASEVYCALVDILAKHLREHSEDMQYIADYLLKFLNWAIENYDKFNVDEEIYGDIREKYIELAKKVKEI